MDTKTSIPALQKADELPPDQPALPSEAPVGIWNKLFINIVIVNIVMNFGQFMMSTLIPKFADHLGASPAVVGVVASIFTVTALAIKPVSGPVIDTLQKKWVLFGAILIIAASFIIYSMAYSLTTLVVARLIHGMGMGFTASTCLSLASEALPQDKLAQGIGYFSLGQAVISAIGPSLGLTLTSRFGYNQTFAICAYIMASSAVLVIFIKAPKNVARKKFKITWNGMFAMEAIIPATLQLFFAMSYMTISSFLVLYAQNDRGVENIGYWFTANAISMLISRPIVGRLGDKYGIHRIMPPAFVIFALSLYVISISDNIIMFLISAVISSWGYGVIMPANQALCMKCVSPDRRGVGGNTNYVGMDIGAFVGPAISGVLIMRFGYSAMYQLMILPIAGAGVVFYLCYPKIKEICTK